MGINSFEELKTIIQNTNEPNLFKQKELGNAIATFVTNGDQLTQLIGVIDANNLSIFFATHSDKIIRTLSQLDSTRRGECLKKNSEIFLKYVQHQIHSVHQDMIFHADPNYATWKAILVGSSVTCVLLALITLLAGIVINLSFLAVTLSPVIGAIPFVGIALLIVPVLAKIIVDYSKHRFNKLEEMYGKKEDIKTLLDDLNKFKTEELEEKSTFKTWFSTLISFGGFFSSKSSEKQELSDISLLMK